MVFEILAMISIVLAFYILSSVMAVIVRDRRHVTTAEQHLKSNLKELAKIANALNVVRNSRKYPNKDGQEMPEEFERRSRFQHLWHSLEQSRKIFGVITMADYNASEEVRSAIDLVILLERNPEVIDID